MMADQTLEKIVTEVDESKGLTVHTIRKTVGIEDIKQKLREFYSGRITKNIIWDFTNASVDSSVSGDNLNFLLRYAKQFSRPGGKTALVATKAKDFDLARIVETKIHVVRKDIELMVFKNYADAIKWLAEQ